ncbi:MAG: DAK2 domain-containing protein [Candidatus Dormibacteria bacterium]
MAAAEAAAAAEPTMVTGKSLRQGLERALRRLAEQREQINDLNVFPVPDGDTGSNMHLTLGAACREVGRLPREAPLTEVARAAAHGALMGARGNSGVILSQVLRGWAERAKGEPALGAEALGQAFAEASKVAYSAVKRPVEGTILSVARDVAEAAQAEVRRGGGLTQLAEAVVAEAWASVERTRNQMELLREAGVVDAGGFGLAVILTAVVEQVGGLAPEKGAEVGREANGPQLRGAAAAVSPEGGFGYCTEFGLVGADLDPTEVRTQLGDDAQDDSALVVGEPGLLHVHLHTAEPWQLLSRAAQLGKIERLKVEDMTAQHRQAQERARPPRAAPTRSGLGVVAVAQGAGFRELLLGLGAAAVVEGGQSQHPSTEQLLRGIEDAGTEGVLLLPNSASLELGAEQAGRICGPEAAVVPSKNLPQGIAALLAFDPGSPLEVNRHRMERAMEGVHAIEVTRAARSTRLGDREVPEGAFMGVLDGELASSGGELAEVVLEALEALPQGAVEVITLYRGADVEVELDAELEKRIRARFPGLEVERHEGGQPLYQFIVSAE